MATLHRQGSSREIERLLIDDPDAYLQSAERLARFLEVRPVSHVLGGHVELDRAGELYPRSTRHHPDERPLSLTRADVMSLPDALRSFNGFYAVHPNYVLSHPRRNLAAVVALLLLTTGAAVVGWRGWRRRRRRRET